jgi:hypothetical protein
VWYNKEEILQRLLKAEKMWHNKTTTFGKDELVAIAGVVLLEE